MDEHEPRAHITYNNRNETSTVVIQQSNRSFPRGMAVLDRILYG
jgi:hypothetical protein